MNRRLVVAWGKGGMSIGGGAQRGVAGLGVSRGFGMGYGMGWVEGIVVTGANGGGREEGADRPSGLKISKASRFSVVRALFLGFVATIRVPAPPTPLGGEFSSFRVRASHGFSRSQGK